MNGSHWRDSVPIKPADALEKLASYVRERMDKRRRAGPKWTFRLAPDLIIQIQPLLPQEKHKRSGLVVKELLEFDGMAVEDEATSASDFDRLWGPDKKHFGCCAAGVLAASRTSVNRGRFIGRKCRKRRCENISSAFEHRRPQGWRHIVLFAIASSKSSMAISSPGSGQRLCLAITAFAAAER
jgi:hypothetical protein